MLDRLVLRIPFDSSYVDTLSDGSSVFTGDVHELNIKLGGRGVHLTEEGVEKCDLVYHCYETLPTSFTDIAFKIFLESQYGYPFVEMKCSPAKILQGHNVFGSLDIELGATEMIMALQASYPEVAALLHVADTTVAEMDITFSARLPNEQTAFHCIELLQNVSHRQTKARGAAYSSTASFGGATSRLRKVKAYIKHLEFFNQLQEHIKLSNAGNEASKRVVNAMTEPRLQEYVKNLLRFEATIKQRWLERRQISNRLIDLIKLQKQKLAEGVCILTQWWQEATKDIFEAFEGMTMRTLDDESVQSRLRSIYFSITKTGRYSYSKANKLFNFYNLLRTHGCKQAKIISGDQMYYINMRELIAAGFSKATLQNLHSDSKTNLIPILRFIQVDFKNQHPDWYQEPVSHFAKLALAA